MNIRSTHLTILLLGLLLAQVAVAQPITDSDTECTDLFIDESAWSCTPPTTESMPSLTSTCAVESASVSWHTIPGASQPMQFVHVECDDSATLYALAADGPIAVRTWRSGEDAFRLVSPGTAQSPSPLVITRVPNALRECGYVPPLLTGTWTPDRGLSGVVARFNMPTDQLPSTTGLAYEDNFGDDTRAVFVSRRADLGISHSWGDAPPTVWEPGAGTTPPFAVFRAESVPAVSLTLHGLSRATDAVLYADDGRRWSVALAAGDSTVELPDGAREGCISLQLDDNDAIRVDALGMNTELDLRPLDRAIEVYLLPELVADETPRRMAASRILSSGRAGTDEILRDAILDADDQLQGAIIDALARRPGAISTLLSDLPSLELGPTALTRLGRAMSDDPAAAAAHLGALDLLEPELQNRVLRSLAWQPEFAPAVVDHLCAGIARESTREDSILSIGMLSDTSLRNVVDCAESAADLETEIAALRGLLLMVRHLAAQTESTEWGTIVEPLALAAITRTNGSVSRLGIGVCIELQTENCLSQMPELSTSDPDPQLRADAFTARIVGGDHAAALAGLRDESATVRLAVARQLLRRRIDTLPISEVEALMVTETWPSVTRLLANWLVFTDQSTPEFLAETAGRLGGADGASLARNMSTAGVFPSCATLFPLIPVEGAGGAAMESPDFVDGVLGLVASCSDYNDTEDPLLDYHAMAATEPRIATAFLQAAAAHQRPWAVDALDALIRRDDEFHLAALRALPWFDDATQQRYVDEFAANETDERAIRMFEILESMR